MAILNRGDWWWPRFNREWDGDSKVTDGIHGRWEALSITNVGFAFADYDTLTGSLLEVASKYLLPFKQTALSKSDLNILTTISDKHVVQYVQQVLNKSALLCHFVSPSPSYNLFWPKMLLKEIFYCMNWNTKIFLSMRFWDPSCQPTVKRSLRSSLHVNDPPCTGRRVELRGRKKPQCNVRTMWQHLQIIKIFCYDIDPQPANRCNENHSLFPKIHLRRYLLSTRVHFDRQC